MATNITSTELDFENIKNSLKVYFAQKSEFNGYDFEASGLNNILDVLAYNTHFNGLIANFATNESFLNTSQLRSSVVSHAEGLGYRPRSRSSSKSTLSLTLDLSAVSSGSRPSNITLPIGTEFTASNEQGEFKFKTRVSYSATDSGVGIYEFLDTNGEPNVVVYEGQNKTKTFYSGTVTENQVYVIPDETIDTKDMSVLVYPSPTSEKFETYTFLENAITVTAATQYYDIKEAPNGYYELNFGDGISFGKSPDPGNKIVVTYNSCNSILANNSSGFSAVNDLSVDGNSYAISVNTQILSHSGMPKETIESIRKLAPIQFSAQQRLVTSLDYKGMIQSNFPIVEDVTVWGGEENVPKDYGKVYISIKYPTNTTQFVKTETENSIKNLFSDNLAVMSIDNKFIEPSLTYMEIKTNFYYNDGLTSQSNSYLETLVRNYISTYFNTNLGKFESKFRRSPILTGIDNIDKSILASKMSIKLQQRFLPNVGISSAYDIYFPVALASASTNTYVITSSRFTVGGATCILRNTLGTADIEIYNESAGKVQTANIGTYDYKTGTISLVGFEPSAIVGGSAYIKVSAVPLDPAVISPLRNYTLVLDESENEAFGNIEHTETKIVL